MTKLHPDKILQRANGISIKINSAQELNISLNQQNLLCSNQALLILEAFAHPISVRKGLEKCNSTGVYDWINLTVNLTELFHFGALRDPSEIEFAPAPKFWAFDSSPAHISMLNDRDRTQKFIEAINEIVREGDVVVEIGTGSGVLAIAAARAGASRVYTIEAGAMARTAQRIINETEVAGKIQVISGWSYQVEIPEKADVLIGEIIGNDPFEENVLQSFADARRRMLKQNARTIPQCLKVFGVPVELPPTFLKNKALTGENIANWRNWYNIDFSHLKDNINCKDEVLLSLKVDRAKELNFLGEGFLITEIDFHIFRDSAVHTVATSKVSKAGCLNGILIYFDLETGSQTITTNPGLTAISSWKNLVWYLSGAKEIKDGDSFSINFSYDGGRNSRISLCD